MILLDTNVVSELMRPAPAPAVMSWLAAQPAASLFISAVTEAELRYGATLLPEGRRRADLMAAVDAMLAEDFTGRILPFDSAAAVAYAAIAAGRRPPARRKADFPIRCTDRGYRPVARRRACHPQCERF
ncbi:PIN domain-containing protein [Acidocella sp.]|uniref:PIN domain-containing protein n=1 Tax=Acidocella sp. TaxID=50710 RepID=UPI003CFC7CB1